MFGINNIQRVSELLKEHSPAPMRVSEIADMLEITAQVAWDNLKELKKIGSCIQIARGQYIYKNEIEDIKLKKIRARNTIRYPLEIWPYEKTLISLLRHAKYRNDECTITKEHLFELWENQKGRCALTEVPLTTVHGNGWQVPTNVSLDRIDSNKNYVLGNVRLVCWQVNMMKGQLTDEELFIFCKLIFNIKNRGA